MLLNLLDQNSRIPSPYFAKTKLLLLDKILCSSLATQAWSPVARTSISQYTKTKYNFSKMSNIDSLVFTHIEKVDPDVGEDALQLHQPVPVLLNGSSS